MAGLGRKLPCTSCCFVQSWTATILQELPLLLFFAAAGVMEPSTAASAAAGSAHWGLLFSLADTMILLLVVDAWWKTLMPFCSRTRKHAQKVFWLGLLSLLSLFLPCLLLLLLLLLRLAPFTPGWHQGVEAQMDAGDSYLSISTLLRKQLITTAW
jgi:hypothetical protein